MTHKLLPEEPISRDTLSFHAFLSAVFQMNLSEFRDLAVGDSPVVLMEGRRAIPELDASASRGFAARLAREFVCLRFRSGNAEGSDEAFSAGVAEVDASRLQVIAPYASHRKKVRYADAIYSSPEFLSSVQEAAITEATVAATPRNANVVYKRTSSPKLGAKASYLIRDTMKVIGHSEEFGPPVCGLFYVDLSDPEAGGTGHTIRVCRQQGVPVAFQDSWMRWFA
jgi:hypothetical protein